MAPQQHQQPERRRVVLCVGDSHTHGSYGASWLRLLAAERPDLQFVNAGVNGETAAAIARRIPALLARYSSHGIAGVTLLAGSNDTIAQEGTSMQALYRVSRRNPTSAPCTQQRALKEIDTALAALASAVPAGTPVCVITLPTLTEAPASRVHRRGRRFNAALKAMVAERQRQRQYGPGEVVLVDFGDACHERLLQASPAYAAAAAAAVAAFNVEAAAGASSPPPPPPAAAASDNQHQQQQQQQSGPWPQQRLTPLAMGWAMLTSWLLHAVLRRPWDAIGASRGYVLLTDGVHLNDAAAEILAGLLREALLARVRM